MPIAGSELSQDPVSVRRLALGGGERMSSMLALVVCAKLTHQAVDISWPYSRGGVFAAAPEYEFIIESSVGIFSSDIRSRFLSEASPVENPHGWPIPNKRNPYHPRARAPLPYCVQVSINASHLGRVWGNSRCRPPLRFIPVS